MNVINPTGYLQLDIIYYVLILCLGPFLLFECFHFRIKRKKIHDAYLESGVEIQGLVTQTKVTVYRGSITRIERRREYQLRYAYKDPSSDSVVVKDFIHVKREQLQQRLFPVVVLPGQPASGVPKFVVRDLSRGFLAKALALVVGSASSVFSMYVFSILMALVTGDCTTVRSFSTSVRVCKIGLWSILLAVLLVVFLGYAFAWVVHRTELGVVPGRVWQRVDCSSVPQDGQGPQSPINLEQIDDRPVPIVQAVAILDEDAERSRAPDLATQADGSVGTTLADNDSTLPEAKAMEIV